MYNEHPPPYQTHGVSKLVVARRTEYACGTSRQDVVAGLTRTRVASGSVGTGGVVWPAQPERALVHIGALASCWVDSEPSRTHTLERTERVDTRCRCTTPVSAGCTLIHVGTLPGVRGVDVTDHGEPGTTHAVVASTESVFTVCRVPTAATARLARTTTHPRASVRSSRHCQGRDTEADIRTETLAGV